MTSTAMAPLLRTRRPARATGVLVAIAGVTAATCLIYPLKHLAPVVSLGVVYLPAVVVVSTLWGLAFGVSTGVISAAAFNFFHLRPTGDFMLSDSRDWVALSAFVLVAVATGLVGDFARARAREAEEGRREADVAASLARTLLGAARLQDALPIAGEQLAETLGVSRASLELSTVQGDEQRLAFALASSGERFGTLLLPTGLSPEEQKRVSQRIVPALESILGAARNRAQLQAEVVETAALRRSDEIKTAILRSVSHDLRTPVTAILTAAAALDPNAPNHANVAEVRELVTDSATRLATLIEKLLDLSLLQAGHLEPRRDWYSIEEVLQEAVESQGDPELFRLSVTSQLPLLRGDPSQLERAFANVLENAARHSDGKPVLIRARAVGSRIRVRIVDQGPGIPTKEQERIFLPFYRSTDDDRAHHGSGLGLAIAKGFIEAGGGRIAVESTPPHGTSFAIELPIPDAQELAPHAPAEPLTAAWPSRPPDERDRWMTRPPTAA